VGKEFSKKCFCAQPLSSPYKGSKIPSLESHFFGSIFPMACLLSDQRPAAIEAEVHRISGACSSCVLAGACDLFCLLGNGGNSLSYKVCCGFAGAEATGAGGAAPPDFK
jgi:hypothetical protein